MNVASMHNALFGRLRAFVRLGRPIFLLGGFALYAVGAAVAAFVGHPIDEARYLWGQLAVTATQLMVHYSNDYFDLEADLANPTPTEWSGGSRVLPKGELPRWVALAAALFLGAVALTATIVLEVVLSGGRAATVVLLAALVLSWEYSSPPLRLHSRGVGEVTAMIIVTLFVPLVGFSAQAGKLEPLVFVAAAPLCFLQFAMLLAVEFPDARGDAKVGKRTLVVRLGASRAAALYVASLVLAYVLLPIWRSLGLPLPVVTALVLLFPLAAWLAWRAIRGEYRQPPHWNRFAFGSAALVMISAVLEAGAFAQLALRQHGQGAVEKARESAQDEQHAAADARPAGDGEHPAGEQRVAPVETRKLALVRSERCAIGAASECVR
jgi:1,4-dihydroxy-2-naphthoate octaprenyltransferase